MGMFQSGTEGGCPSSPEKCFIQFSRRSAELPSSISPQLDLVLPVISLTRFHLVGILPKADICNLHITVQDSVSQQLSIPIGVSMNVPSGIIFTLLTKSSIHVSLREQQVMHWYIIHRLSKGVVEVLCFFNRCSQVLLQLD